MRDKRLRNLILNYNILSVGNNSVLFAGSLYATGMFADDLAH